LCGVVYLYGGDCGDFPIRTVWQEKFVGSTDR
jgi:hypothetical protein